MSWFDLLMLIGALAALAAPMILVGVVTSRQHKQIVDQIKSQGVNVMTLHPDGRVEWNNGKGYKNYRYR